MERDDACLDSDVAKQVMDWRWSDAWGCLIPPEQTAKPDEMWTEWKWDGKDYSRSPIRERCVSGIQYSGDLRSIYLPKYTTSLEDAWKVVWKMREHNMVLDLYQGVPHDEWCATFFIRGAPRGRPGYFGYKAYAETPAMAICLAAIRAKKSLNECPFCGADGKVAEVSDGNGYYTFIECENCGARGPWGWSCSDLKGRSEIARNGWNRRTR